MESIYLTRNAKDPIVYGWKNDKIRLITPFVRFIEGLEWFNIEIVSKTPNMVFFYVCMAFIVGMTPKHAKQGIFTLE